MKQCNYNHIILIMTVTQIVDTLVQETKVVFDMINLGITNMDDQIWTEIENDWSYLNTLYHIIETLEFYIYDNPEELKQSTLGIKIREVSEGKINLKIININKITMNEYLDEVQKLVLSTLNSYNDYDLLKTDEYAKWGFKSIFHKISYTLRHTMFHLGELSKFLRENDYDHMKWL